MDLVAAVFLASHVPRDSGPHQGLTGTWCVVATSASPGPGDSGLHLRLTWIWWLWSPRGLHLDLGTPVPIWASPGPVDHGPQLGKIWDPVTVFHNWTSPGPGYSGPTLGLTVP